MYLFSFDTNWMPYISDTRHKGNEWTRKLRIYIVIVNYPINVNNIADNDNSSTRNANENLQCGDALALDIFICILQCCKMFQTRVRTILS